MRAFLVATALVVVSACSSGQSSTKSESTAPRVTDLSTTASSFASPSEALLARLSTELGDRTLAQSVVSAAGADGVTAWTAAVGESGLATSDWLGFQPSTAPPGTLDAYVVFAFGNRLAADGSPEPGPVNDALAATTAALVAQHPLPVYAQWEVARGLEERSVNGVVAIEPVTAADGSVTYLSTAGVAAKAKDLAAAAGHPLRHVGVIAFADHAVRCLFTVRAAGIDADVPRGVDLPSDYDAESGQPWTRQRAAYIPTDLAGRLLLRGSTP